MQKIIAVLIITFQLFLTACQLKTKGNDGNNTEVSVVVSPLKTSLLSPALSETSGLMIWDGYIWTHNDHGDTILYGLDPNSAEIAKEYHLQGVVNTDWEEISQDDQYIYLGDFGNNASGNRTDLHILRIEKDALKAGNQRIDTIWFSYSNQTDLRPQRSNATDFDCEAMILSGDSIYLFTKQWISGGSSIYSIPKYPGVHMARYKASHYVSGMVTGASYIESKHLVVLCGYTLLLDPFFYLLYDFRGTDFFSGNKQKVGIVLPFHQIEGLATEDGISYYISNERTQLEEFPDKAQGLHTFDLSPFL